MSVKLLFCIGHTAQLKTKPSKDGFTHDWELFLRGANENSDLSFFVDKVVFNLHDSFPKPRRVISSQPFIIKESGYAAFELSIDIYLKSRDELKKIIFNYDMDLQAEKREMREFIIQNPSEDFKRKCLKGGGMLIANSGGGVDYKSSKQDAHKRPHSSNEMKKAKKPEENKQNKIFTDLFGPPIEKPPGKPVVNKAAEKAAARPTLPPPSKEKSEKTKHKYNAADDRSMQMGKEKKASSDVNKITPEKPKKDKVKDREHNKKEKLAAENMPQTSASQASNRSNQAGHFSKSDASKNIKDQNISSADAPSESKKSNKKKSYEKDREKVDKKESKTKEKNSTNSTASAPPAKTEEHDQERKHKHKKKEKTKDRSSKERDKKNKGNSSSNTPNAETKKKYEKPPEKNLSDSENESMFMKEDTTAKPSKAKQAKMNEPEDYSSSSNKKKFYEEINFEEKDEKRNKRKHVEERNSRSPVQNFKQQRTVSPFPPVEKSQSARTAKSSAQENEAENKNNSEYLEELKKLKQKIVSLKNNDHLQQVVKLIASTGRYEITKSTFDFDLVKLDRPTINTIKLLLREIKN